MQMMRDKDVCNEGRVIVSRYQHACVVRMRNDTTRRKGGTSKTCARRSGAPFAEKGEGPRCQRRHRPLPDAPEDARAFLDLHSSERVAQR